MSDKLTIEYGEKISTPFMKVISNAGWLTVLQAAGDISGFILYIFLSRYYGPEGIGIYAFAYSVVMLLSIIHNFGFDNFGIRECSYLEENKKRNLLGSIISAQVSILLLVLLAFIVFILISSQSKQTLNVMIVLFIYLAILVSSDALFIPANSKQQMVYPASINQFAKIASVLFAVLLVVFFKVELYIALLPFPCFAIFVLASAYHSSKKFTGKIEIRFNYKTTFVLMKKVWPFTGSNVTNQIYARAGLIIITILHGNSPAGIFASAQKFLEVGLMPISFLGFSIYPALSKSFRQNSDDFAASIEKYFGTIFIISAFLVWGLYYIVPVAIIPLFGQKFTGSVSLVRYFALVAIIYSFSTSFCKIFLSSNLQVLSLKFEFAALIINLLASLVLIKLYGPLGAVIALIISETALNILYLLSIKYKINTLFKRLKKAFTEFFLILSIPLLVGLLFSFLNFPDLYGMIATLILFLVVILSTGFIHRFKYALVN